MGIEPTSEAWEAPVLPLNYVRLFKRVSQRLSNPLKERLPGLLYQSLSALSFR